MCGEITRKKRKGLGLVWVHGYIFPCDNGDVHGMCCMQICPCDNGDVHGMQICMLMLHADMYVRQC